MPAKGFPIAFTRIFPAAKPFQAVGDVADFVTIDFFEQFGCHVVAHRREAACEVAREIQIRLLEREAQAGDVIHRVFHHGNRPPEIAAHRQFAEVDAAFLHALEIKLRVLLFVLECLQDAFAERDGRIRKF